MNSRYRVRRAFDLIGIGLLWLALAASVSAGAPAPSFANPDPIPAGKPMVTGVFSNMHFATEDVLGVEIFVTLSDEGYFAQIQCAEGAVSKPVIIPVVVDGTRIEFDIPAHPGTTGYTCPAGKFKGEVSAAGLKGTIGGTGWPRFLKRKKSYWQ
jgi:hypothetical protein